MSDEGFYDPELHSIDEDERVLHVPVCSVGAVKTVWSDLLGAGAGDWNASALKSHVVALMEKNLGKDRAHRRAFAKEADLPAWFETDILIGSNLFPHHYHLFHFIPPPFSFCSNSCILRYSDQTLLSGALHSWRHFPDHVELVARNTQLDRIDRLLWKVPESREKLGR